MGVQWGGKDRRRSTDLWNAGAAGALVGGLLIGTLVWATDDDPPPPVTKGEVTAAVIVDATTIEMHGYDKTGKPGTFLYDCEHRDKKQGDVPGDPTLVCTQREEKG